ncbi:hypothetical protein AGABI2DRAFT_74407 [Agaricus bisporus var. bisporus H97]|uniref:hypothetical protein n=1 Tax=Agaricus bisporus var. bisporus (strain H97 / ATCC MYA-4626 / FGSC 10389) TaxID=936046 RepID=UPI00029F74BC|nr:hypothetical protein AGABI2DRAFT_74407 [Agaricus bisporus var. bisporus H97]EKV44496.1 hypothetical protein AGABI2DRAFT_74407 [Agaricus bisporus var. bisporus H97]
MIIPYFHFAGGDHLLFKAWQPTSAGAIVGACLGVFFLAIFERLVYAFSHVLVHYLMRRQSPSRSSRDINHISKSHDSSKSFEISVAELEEGNSPPRTTIAPFIIPSIDIPRGILYGFQTLLIFFLMLIARTYHAGYILSVIAGLTLGETLFGRIPHRMTKDVDN